MKKVALFDFDGVINDSVSVKTQAFLDVYKSEASKTELKLIEDYHMANGGINRVHKFRHFEEQIFKREVTDSSLNKLLDSFNRNLEVGLSGKTIFRGTRECLEKLKRREVRLYIISGAPKDEVQKILERNNLSHYFCEVLGGSSSKVENIQRVFGIERLPEFYYFFIGDSLTDYTAAKESNVDFIAVNPNFDIQEKEKFRFKNIQELSNNLDRVLEMYP